MKSLILCLALAAAVASAQVRSEPPIPILRQAQDVGVDGTYSYNYETGHGISASESGSPSGVLNAEGQSGTAVQGQFQYTSDDGTPISLIYTANENGFQPQGAHLPVAPPIPIQIQRALEYIAAHPTPASTETQQSFGQRF